MWLRTSGGIEHEVFAGLKPGNGGSAVTRANGAIHMLYPRRLDMVSSNSAGRRIKNHEGYQRWSSYHPACV